MIKKWTVKIPQALYVQQTLPVKDIFEKYTGVIGVGHIEWEDRSATLWGEHESDDVHSQTAVITLIDLVRRFANEVV